MTKQKNRLVFLAKIVVLVFVIPFALLAGAVAGLIDCVRSWFGKTPLFS